MHPHNIPYLPSYHCLSYQKAAPKLKLVNDVWQDLEGCVSEYLSKEYKEPTPAYRNRIKRTKFDNRFEPAIKGHAGLLSAFQLEDAAQSIVENLDNIDNLGNSVYSFFNEADQKALCDGWCGILIEFPNTEYFENQADYLANGLSPYLVLIDRKDILNWRYAYDSQGKAEISQVTIREKHIVPDGDFGEKVQVLYRVLHPGYYRVLEIVENKNNYSVVVIEEGETSLNQIPLVDYSVHNSELFCSPPPLINLAELNIEHFQKRSQLTEVMRKCNLPVPVRKGLIRTKDDIKKAPPVTIGPNSAIDIPADGDFYFAEPTGAAIQSTENNIEKLDAAMDRLSLAFLTGGENYKSVAEVLLSTAQTGASLKNYAERKQSKVQEIFNYWVQYTGEVSGGTISVDERILQSPLSPEATSRLQDLAQAGFLSHRSLLHLLKLGKVLSRDFDIKEELSLTEGNSEE